MKILHTVEHYYPSIGGMPEVVKHLSEKLVKLGHNVTVVTTKHKDRTFSEYNGVKIEEFEIKGNYVSGIFGKRGELPRYHDLLKNSDFNVITNFAAHQWTTDACLNILDDIKAKKVFVPTGFSRLYDENFSDYFEKMKVWLKKYDMNVFLSDNYRDINFARKNGVEKRILIPNGAEEREFSIEYPGSIREELGIPKDHILILHVGSHTGTKGHKEAFEIFEKANISNASFVISANDFGDKCTKQCKKRKFYFKLNPKRVFDKKQFIVGEFSRERTVALYQEADLFLFPSNIECSPIVLFECMASKTPFLTSDVGNSAEIISWSNAGELLPTTKQTELFGLTFVDIEKSVRILENIFKDYEKRKLYAQNGFKSWKEKFSWEKIAKEYEKMYLNL
ncbi:MAG: glycosyltransferase family 4 protein [Candidatus Gastranaerophilales bacterium]|nr:glycosyltransferase family 4 protein [Candidatus Gastranaerophilales bacterium]